jgi:hypothetical protein
VVWQVHAQWSGLLAMRLWLEAMVLHMDRLRLNFPPCGVHVNGVVSMLESI